MTTIDVQSFGTTKDLDEFLKSSNKLILLHVELENVAVCKALNEALLAIGRNDQFNANLLVGRINADHFGDFLSTNKVTAVPTVLFYHRSKLLDRVDGFNQSELIKKVQTYSNQLDFSSKSNETTPVTTSEVEKKIRELLKSSRVMLFMKGTPNEPQCGFSRQACHILSEHQIPFQSFDVLSDQNVREQLKIFSNWNTYPQLYLDGELIGGLDIMKQMVETGDFDEKFAAIKSKDMTKHLESLIRQAPLMLFIKGTPDAPRCGFTRELIQLLNKANITDYKTFDILQDEDVRQKLKEYSSWQTYPQIYVNGQLIGGLDILKQLDEEGTLVETLMANRGVAV